MNKSTSIGIVWPGPPTPEDIAETRRYMPPGVGLHMIGTRPPAEADLSVGITIERLLKMPGDSNIEDAAEELVPMGVASIVYGCTSASYIRGVGGDTDIAGRINAATGLPATTTSGAAVAALRHLGVRQVSVLSPHVDELNERLHRFLSDSGFEVVHLRGLNKLSAIEEIPQEDIRELVLQLVNQPDADGIFISCTGMRTSSILDGLEADTGKPVVSAMQASVWEVLLKAGLTPDVAGVGSLFRQPAYQVA
jgi:maleate isomerase